MLTLLMSMLVLVSLATASAIPKVNIVEIRYKNQLLGECGEVSRDDFEGVKNLEFAKKYHFYKFIIDDQYNVNTNITGYTQKEYCGIGTQLCYNLRGTWSNYKRCNLY